MVQIVLYAGMNVKLAIIKEDVHLVFQGIFLMDLLVYLVEVNAILAHMKEVVIHAMMDIFYQEEIVCNVLMVVTNVQQY